MSERRLHNRVANGNVTEISQKIGHKHHNRNVEHIHPQHLRKVNIPSGSNKETFSDGPKIKFGRDFIFDENINFVVFHDNRYKKLFAQYGFIGSPIGPRQSKNYFESDGPYGLSTYDILYAYELGLIVPENQNYSELSSTIKNWGTAHEEKFNDKYLTYRALRQNGLLVLNAHQYGNDFAVYDTSAEDFIATSGKHKHNIAFVYVINDPNKFTVYDAVQKERVARKTGTRFIITNVNNKSEVNAWIILPDKMGIDVSQDVNALVLKRIVNSGHYNTVPFELGDDITFRR